MSSPPDDDNDDDVTPLDFSEADDDGISPSDLSEAIDKLPSSPLLNPGDVGGACLTEIVCPQVMTSTTCRRSFRKTEKFSL